MGYWEKKSSFMEKCLNGYYFCSGIVYQYRHNCNSYSMLFYGNKMIIQNLFSKEFELLDLCSKLEQFEVNNDSVRLFRKCAQMEFLYERNPQFIQVVQ